MFFAFLPFLSSIFVPCSDLFLFPLLPLSQVVWKRWVALAKAEGDLPEAIKRCNEYLKVFQGDTSAVRAERGS